MSDSPNHKPLASITTSVSAQFYTGLIPHPEFLKQYNDILPGSANRLLTMAENQENHRIEMETIQLKKSHRNSLLGLIGGFIILLIVVLLGGYLIINNKPIEGFTSLILGIGSLVSSYFKGINSQKAERLERLDKLEKITKPKK